MSVAKDCQRYAVRCLQDARTTVDSRQKTFLVEMAQAWQRLAERETQHLSQTARMPELSSGLYKRSRVICALRASGCGRVKGTSAQSFVGSCLSLSEKLPIERATRSFG